MLRWLARVLGLMAVFEHPRLFVVLFLVVVLVLLGLRATGHGYEVRLGP